MDKLASVTALAALAQATRLDVFRLLVAHEPEGLAAGDIARRLGVPHNTLSAHLGILAQAGLVAAARHGRRIIYRVELAAMRGLVMFLLRDCCGGRPELCAPLVEDLSRCQCREGAACA